MGKLALIAAAGLGIATATQALAAPGLGDTVTCSAGAFTCLPSSTTVSAGPEFILFDAFSGGNTFSVDFATGQVTFTAVFGAPLSSVSYSQVASNRLTFADLASPFTEATLIASSGLVRFDQSNVSLSNGSLVVALGQQANSTVVNRGAAFTVRLGTQAAAAPEPATWGMLLLGMGMVGAGLRARRRPASVTYA